jgi:taurine dioxygenase
VIAIRKSDGCMGAEISGVDLSRPLPDRIFGAVRSALHRHQVLVFRGQSLELENSLAFANRLGRSEPHVLDQFHHPQYTDILVLSNVKKNGKPTGLADGGTYWHSDYSYLQIPARATLLYSIQVPKVGGDTLFAEQEQAYEDLPPAMKKRIDGMVTLNIYGNRDDLDLSSRTSAFPTPGARHCTRYRVPRSRSRVRPTTKVSPCCASWPRIRPSGSTSTG